MRGIGTLGFVALLACSTARDEAWQVELGTIVARPAGSPVTDAEVRRTLASAWELSPMFEGARADRGGRGDPLDAELGYWEVLEEDGARQLVVSLLVDTPPELASRPRAPRRVEATVLLERDEAVPLERDLALAVRRAVAVIDARTRLVHGGADQLQALLRGPDPELTVLALEWVRDHVQREHLDDVLRLLEHDDEGVFLAAVEALGAVGGPEHAAALIGRVRLDDAAQAHRAYEALADLGGPDAAAFLRFAAQNEDDPSRRRAARSALRALGSRDSVDPPPEIGHRR